MTAAVDLGTATLSTFARVAGLLLLAIGSVLAFVFAFAAMLVVGVMILGAAIAMRLMPRRAAAAAESRVLEARRTPTGWVVEGAAKPKS